MELSIDVVRLRQPDAIDDPLTGVLRAGARLLLAQAVELEVEALLAEREGLKRPDGRAPLVRHGHGPEREVQTGIAGPAKVASASVSPRRSCPGGRGLSTGDFQEALSASLGQDAPNLSPR